MGKMSHLLPYSPLHLRQLSQISYKRLEFHGEQNFPIFTPWGFPMRPWGVKVIRENDELHLVFEFMEVRETTMTEDEMGRRVDVFFGDGANKGL